MEEQSVNICVSYRFFVWNEGPGQERDSHCMQDWAFTLQTKLVKAKKNTDMSSFPLSFLD